jgi:hypothetical protein
MISDMSPLSECKSNLSIFTSSSVKKQYFFAEVLLFSVRRVRTYDNKSGFKEVLRQFFTSMGRRTFIAIL